MSRELVERAQNGDHDAFDRLAAQAFDRLYAVAHRILRDPHAAEDAVQDALFRSWRELRGLRDPDRFDAWLYRLLVNACHDAARRSRRRPMEVAVLPVDRPEERDHPAELADRELLTLAFARLSVDQRAVVVLHHYVGLRAAELATILGIPIGTVQSRLHYGIAALRGALEAEARSGPVLVKGKTA